MWRQSSYQYLWPGDVHDKRRGYRPLRSPSECMTTIEHTARLLAASARQLQDAACKIGSEDLRISCAFVAAYNAMQAILPPHSGPLDDHPLASIVRNGAARTGITEADRALGLRLREWENFGRYLLEPAPVVSVEEAIAWAVRVRDAVLKLL